jgi:hypothetical protein
MRLFIISILIITTSCSTKYITKSNFEDNMEIHIYSGDLYHGNNQVKNRKGCFPNNLEIICPGTYKETGKADAKIFQISSSTYSKYGGKHQSDFMNLAASDTTLLRGFKYFVIIRFVSQMNCETTYHKKTKGHVSFGKLNLNSRYSKSDLCLLTKTNSVLAFNDLIDVEKGIFKKEFGKLVPLFDLYRTPINNRLYPKEYSYEEGVYITQNLVHYLSSTDWKSWKRSYSAKKVIELTEAKYELSSEKRNYKLYDYSKPREPSEKSILEQSKVK